MAAELEAGSPGSRQVQSHSDLFFHIFFHIFRPRDVTQFCHGSLNDVTQFCHGSLN
jgi:hypothetical protein